MTGINKETYSNTNNQKITEIIAKISLNSASPNASWC